MWSQVWARVRHNVVTFTSLLLHRTELSQKRIETKLFSLDVCKEYVAFYLDVCLPLAGRSAQDAPLMLRKAVTGHTRWTRFRNKIDVKRK